MKIYEMIFILDKSKEVRVLVVAERLGDAINSATESIALKHGNNIQTKLKIYEEYTLDTNHVWVFDV